MKQFLYKISQLSKGLILFLGLIFGFVFTMSPTALAESATITCADGEVVTMTMFNGMVCAKPNGAPNNIFGVNGVFVNITNTAMFLLGALSVIMLIYGGIRYTLSGGNAEAVKNAKNTILYAVIGVVVAIMAFAAVNFVIGQLAQPTVTTT